MSTPTNHWKLGLFMVLGVVLIASAVVYFGGRSLKKETVAYRTYFDESVQGLELGSPVKFRGVSIGNVSQIDLAGDLRHVEVTFELGVKVLTSLGLTHGNAKEGKTKLVVPPDLRAQLASTGITGVKFLNLDFFPSKTNPLPELPFEPAENYVPSVPSTLKNLEDSVVSAVDKFPELAKALVVVLGQLSAILGGVDGNHLPEKLAQTLENMNKVLDQVNGAVSALDTGALSKDARATLTNLNVAVTQVNQVLQKVGGDKGLAVSLQHTSESVGAMAQNANQVGPALEDTLKDVQEAAISVRRLADALELDPDMLLKGRAKRVSK